MRTYPCRSTSKITGKQDNKILNKIICPPRSRADISLSLYKLGWVPGTGRRAPEGFTITSSSLPFRRTKSLPGQDDQDFLATLECLSCLLFHSNKHLTGFPRISYGPPKPPRDPCITAEMGLNLAILLYCPRVVVALSLYCLCIVIVLSSYSHCTAPALRNSAFLTFFTDFPYFSGKTWNLKNYNFVEASKYNCLSRCSAHGHYIL